MVKNNINFGIILKVDSLKHRVSRDGNEVNFGLSIRCDGDSTNTMVRRGDEMRESPY